MCYVTTLLGLVFLSSPVQAFFLPLTTVQRVAASDVIAVIEVTKVDHEMGVSEAVVVHEVLGAKAGLKLQIWDDWQMEADGKKSRISGRDPALEVGKRYFIYLTTHKNGRLVTPRSSLDCAEVVGTNVKKAGENGFEPLAEMLTKVKALTAKRKETQAGPPNQNQHHR